MPMSQRLDEPSAAQTEILTLKNLLTRLTSGQNLSRNEAAHFLDALLDSEATDAQIAAALIALKLKGETVEELAGLAQGMRQRAIRINCSHSCFIDTAGTGSSRAKRSEEHTSELQSLRHLVCRLLLENKK